MKPPLFVRPLTPAEREALERGLRSARAFVVRRCQCLLKSAEGLTPQQIERQLGCSDQTVRNALQAFAREGLGCLEEPGFRSGDACLERGRSTSASPGEAGGEGRAEGARVLWALAARERTDAAALCGRAAGECHHRGVPGVGFFGVAPGREAGAPV